MTFTYEVENEDGEVVKTYIVEATFATEEQGRVSGRPERCYPASGGDLEDIAVYLGNKDVTHQIDDDLYFRIKDAAREKLR
jgi:hypothetical protein